jgi:hypothetical protein
MISISFSSFDRHARSDVLDQVLLPFLKGHAAASAACMPTVQSRCIGTEYQLESPATKLVTIFFSCCGAGACSMSGSQTIEVGVRLMYVLSC